MSAIITVDKLSKKYKLGLTHTDLLSEKIGEGLRRLFRRPPAVDRRLRSGDMYALQDVSFDIQAGEVVGIIGRNGAGKSTLLKILSRITTPTSGEIVMYGRMASLLEVGTGFHQELTGRENIFLNGAILGMTRAEIRRKFDEIVAFAEVDKFIDTPVKRYSSGMYVRLAFAVAAHLEPEILIVDEVLAVGDVAFQKKCLGKMEQVAKEGRTVLFVSHNMGAVENLCGRGIYLRDGKLVDDGETRAVIDHYLADTRALIESQSLRERKDRHGNGKVRFVDFHVQDTQGRRQTSLKSGEDYTFVLFYERTDDGDDLRNVSASVALLNNHNETVMLVQTTFTNENLTLPKDRAGRIECTVRDFNLTSGTFSTALYIGRDNREVFDFVTDACEIFVEGGDFFGTGSIGLPTHCKMLTRASWLLAQHAGAASEGR